MCNKDQFKFFFFVKLPVFTYYIDKSQVLIMIILFSHLPYSDPPPPLPHTYIFFDVCHTAFLNWKKKKKNKTRKYCWANCLWKWQHVSGYSLWQSSTDLSQDRSGVNSLRDTFHTRLFPQIRRNQHSRSFNEINLLPCYL